MSPESLGTYYESLLETEVRKEGGIYYTPPLIVDYMVAESVGKLLKNKTLKEAERIKIVDPSCGGGICMLLFFIWRVRWIPQFIERLPFFRHDTQVLKKTEMLVSKILIKN